MTLDARQSASFDSASASLVRLMKPNHHFASMSRVPQQQSELSNWTELMF
jgi:hypothetical protein